MVVAARMRQFGYTKKRAREQWAGYEIGRMALAGHFGTDFEAEKVLSAVEGYVKATAAYLRLKSPLHPLPKAMDYLAGRGTSLASELSEKQVRAIEAAYEAYVGNSDGVKGKLSDVNGLDRMIFHEVAFHDRTCGTERIQAVKNCVKALQGA